MVNNNPYQAYKQQSVMTMTPGEMLTSLYNGLLKELVCAGTAFEAKDYGEINRRLQKAQALLSYLRNSLDYQYEISKNLNSLYDYFINVTVQANIKKDPSELPAVIQMITELRDTYVQADRKMRSGEAVG